MSREPFVTWPRGMSVRSARGVLWTLALVGLAGCGTVRSQQPPSVSLASLTLLESTTDAQRYRVLLEFENPNPEPITISRVAFRVRLGGQGYLRGESSTALEIAAGDRSSLGVDVSSEIVSSLSQLLAVVQGPEHALPYEIAGDLTLAGRRGTPYPFRASGRVPLAMTR